jgi:hypothetical protein
MRFVAHPAPSLSCLATGGNVRSIANKIAYAQSVAGKALQARASELRNQAYVPGRVYSCGSWSDDEVHSHLAAVLGSTLGSGLRTDFEWYCCRGAFFHNDAHYDGRLFGTWSIGGPAHYLVFPRESVRLTRAPNNIAIFDPFEVHGILLERAKVFEPADYADSESTAILGFELDLTPAIADAFGIASGATERVISSATRISASNGAFAVD